MKQIKIFIKTSIYTNLIFFFQSARCIVYVVPESSEVDKIHRLAQLQMENT